jgi:serine O-acetyltransferase
MSGARQPESGFMLAVPDAGPDFSGEARRAAQALGEIRRTQRSAGRTIVAHFPSQTEIAKAVDHLAAALYPRRLGAFRAEPAGEDGFVAGRLAQALTILHDEVSAEFAYWQAEADTAFDPDQAATVTRYFAAALPRVRELIDTDVEAAFLGDPAATSSDEILVCYPGAIAILHHRLAHELHRLGAPIVARIISELANARTGIDIHPGAVIGPGFFIDHGTGVVIGETAIVGARVRLYQHVTLGAPGPLGASHVSARTRYARHPIVEDDVVIYAGATILGRVTIGRGATIGGNVWLLEDVAPGAVVLQPPASTVPAEEGRRVLEQLSGRAG